LAFTAENENSYLNDSYLILSLSLFSYLRLITFLGAYFDGVINLWIGFSDLFRIEFEFECEFEFELEFEF